MTTRKKRPKRGDLLKVKFDGGSAHLQYLGKHPKYGDTVRVVASEYMPDTLTDRDTLLAKGYVAFYPVVAAANQGLVEVVGHHGAGTEIPSKLRRAGAVSNDGRVLTWVIEEGGNWFVTKTLTPEQLAMPIAAIWNHEMLWIRIREGWRPEKEGAMSDRDVVAELRNIAGGDKETTVLHYIYFPTEQSARAAAATLSGKGFKVESRLGADGMNWLVLARHRVVPDEAQMERHRTMFEVVASEGGGEYDGWEAEVS